MAQLKTALGKVDSFLDKVLAHVPEDKRETLRSEYSQTKDSVVTLDDLIVKVQATAAEQSAWWDANKDKVVKHDELAAQVAANRTADAPTGYTKADVDKLLTDQRAEVLGMGLAMVTDGSTIVATHLKEFGDVLDMQKLATEAMKTGQTLSAYYDQMVAPKREERKQAAITAQIAAAKEEGRKEGTAAAMNRGADFPSVGSRGPATLDGLRKPAEGQPAANPDHSLEAAVATATALMQGQT